MDNSIYFGSVPPPDPKVPYENDNSIFDVKAAHWNADHTQVVDSDGEYIDGEFLKGLAGDSQHPGAALTLAVANARENNEVGMDEDFSPTEIAVITRELTKIGMSTGILDEGPYADKAKSWIRALAEALGKRADELAHEMEALSLELNEAEPEGIPLLDPATGQPVLDADGNQIKVDPETGEKIDPDAAVDAGSQKMMMFKAAAGEFELFMGTSNKALDSAVNGVQTLVK